MKKEYFNQDLYTDVIAFNIDDDPFEGEIYISMPTARENAYKFNQAYEKEVTRLIIHGVLHLLDYSDCSFKEKQTMSKMEENILKETRWKTLFEI